MSIITTRQHAIMAARRSQLRLNRLASDGGRPYVEARLWRAPNETDASWNGVPNEGIVGRRTRTASVDDAARVSEKINQYIFKKPVLRKGADEAFLRNCTGDGESVHEFMQNVNASITAGRWCWLQADRAPLPEGAPETLADKAPVRWLLWGALDVPDWCVDAGGEIRWLITRSSLYRNEDPRRTAVEAELYTLWELDGGKVYVTEEAVGPAPVEGLRTRAELPGLGRIPFVLAGRPSADAWWFDDVENLQATILNMDSMHTENLTETIYPQLVLPSGLMQSLQMKLRQIGVKDGNAVVTALREITLGRKYPIMESNEDKGVSRYIMPNGDLKALPEECDRKRRILFDRAGMALFNRETRQVETAESKSFDQLDTNSTLGNRALLLQSVEARLVELTRVFDPSFRGWEPVYNTAFDVVDVAALGSALAQAANVPDKTPLVRRLVAKANVRILKEVGGGIATDEEFEAAIEEIDRTDFAAPPGGAMLPDPFGALAGGVSQEEAERLYEEMMSK